MLHKGMVTNIFSAILTYVALSQLQTTLPRRGFVKLGAFSLRRSQRHDRYALTFSQAHAVTLGNLVERNGNARRQRAHSVLIALIANFRPQFST